MIANSVSVVAHTNAHTGEKEMLFTLKAIAQKCDELSDQMAGQLVMDFARPLLERLQGDLAMAIASDAAVSEIKGQVIIGVDKHCFDWNKRQKSAERMPAELGYWEEELYEATLEAKAPQRIYKQGEGSW